MNKIEVKRLFWEIVNTIEGCSDSIVKNAAGVVTERGMQLSNGYSVMFGQDYGVIRIYNEEYFPLIAFTEENELLIILKELFEQLEI
jgi:hypothetical protein